MVHRAGLVAIVTMLATGCVHAPPPRTATAGEPVVLEAVSFEAPSGEGWRIHDSVDLDRRLVELWQLHPDGTWDRRAWVEEHVRKVTPTSPEGFLAGARKALPATGATATISPARDEAMALDGRFGPLSAVGTVTMDPSAGHEDEAVRGTFHVREWISPERPDRHVRAAWVERAQPARAAAADPPWGPFEASLRSPPAPGAQRSTPDVEEAAWWGFEPGAMVASLRGERLVGGGGRFSFLGGMGYPRAGTFEGATLDISTFVGGNDEWFGLVTTLGLTAWQGRGRLRWGGGLELGLSTLDQVERDHGILGFVLGARAATQVDLVRYRWPKGVLDVFLELDAGVATPWLYRAGAWLGFRAGSRRW